MDDFYMVLPSNVHWSAEPPNTTGNYKTPLPKPLELEQDRWQVALTEISYPQSWSKEIPAKLFDFTLITRLSFLMVWGILQRKPWKLQQNQFKAMPNISKISTTS